MLVASAISPLEARSVKVVAASSAPSVTLLDCAQSQQSCRAPPTAQAPRHTPSRIVIDGSRSRDAASRWPWRRPNLASISGAHRNTLRVSVRVVMLYRSVARNDKTRQN